MGIYSQYDLFIVREAQPHVLKVLIFQQINTDILENTRIPLCYLAWPAVNGQNSNGIWKQKEAKSTYTNRKPKSQRVIWSVQWWCHSNQLKKFLNTLWYWYTITTCSIMYCKVQYQRNCKQSGLHLHNRIMECKAIYFNILGTLRKPLT